MLPFAKRREAKDLTKADLAILFGSAPQAYGRYEQGITKLTVTRLIQLCEVLDILPDDLLFDAAPHLWGCDPQEAEKRRRIMQMAQTLPLDRFDIISTVLECLLTLGKVKSQ